MSSRKKPEFARMGKPSQEQPKAQQWEPLERLDISKPPYSTSKNRPPWLMECWQNNCVWVQVQYHETSLPDGNTATVKHLYIGRMDKAPIHQWYVFQQVKNEVCGPECEAVEIYPPQSELFDSANIYHLWVLPAGVRLPFGIKVAERGDAKTVAFLTAEPER